MRLDFSSVFLSKGINYFSEDRPLRTFLEYTGFRERSGTLSGLGLYVSEELMEEAMFLDHFGRPKLVSYGIDDRRLDAVWLSRSHWDILRRLHGMGVNSSIYRERDLMTHFLSAYLVSDAGLFCTLTLTGQTLYALMKYGSGALDRYVERFAGPDMWLGATFYTEIQAGSDLANTRTEAVPDGERFRLHGGNKYFASNAGLADGAIVTARVRGSPPGIRSVCTFFVPARRDDGTPNYEVRRLKDKLGTVLVPTGEVILEGSEAYLLGKQGDGIYQALEILTMSRIDDAMAAVGMARKALWEACLYASARSAFGRPVVEHPLAQRDLIELESDLEAATVLSLVAADRFSRCIDERPPYTPLYQYARALSHLAKNLAAWTSDRVTRYAMELMGGRGFLSEYVVEKLHRDAIVTSIWEGTSNIQALDFMEVLPRVREAIQEEVERVRDASDRAVSGNLKVALDSVMDTLYGAQESGTLQYYQKQIADGFARLMALTYLYDAYTDTGERLVRMAADLYYRRNFTEVHGNLDFSQYTDLYGWMLLGRKG
ncbi:acyl-CoA dehydrogenase [Thermogymnomonas acidicola]|uniref:Acyl-CoA dehydrogenase n=1 Tax=Thermogymnomonas acidicola TaxID=399579 RepID=A0AA37BS36_9ARCH|nr:acyl-CoA dehydrogenase family protein [Thermogymnomonas acidicola]GGM77117.1 acyl-CoA dehydrogenase [Thermogymnomonas acidicola]